MIEGPNKLQIEDHLVTLNGLAQALSLMSHSPNLQATEQEAIGGMAAAIEGEFNALWRLMFGGEFPRPGEHKEGQP